MPRCRDDSESSSASNNSGPEFDWDSDELESSSDSSSSIGPSSKGTPQSPGLDQDTPGSGSGSRSVAIDEAGAVEQVGMDSVTQWGMEGSQEERMESQEAGQKTGRRNRRLSLLKSHSLPTSFTPSSFSRPPSVISTLHLQVLSSKHGDTPFHTMPIFVLQLPSERGAFRQEEEQGTQGGGQDRSNSPPPPQPMQWWQTGLPWQQLQGPTNQQHLYQQQQPEQYQHAHQYGQHHQQQMFSPLSSWEQEVQPPPPTHTFPVLPMPLAHTLRQVSNTPQAHLQTITPHTCCCLHNTHVPLPPAYWSSFSRRTQM
ncbi:uncharacterized protein LOC130122889 [Lampris incognitus]|uniref:uncharacterized protein LOC130122889 n=1 Tax=Lampris incognitus TaxID=2546036 RepID=UPI0024B56D23|nr:uncharacterized protein LOC130122889 [Lampris incognitus]